MRSLSTLEVIISYKNHCQIATNIFQGYIDEDFKSKLFWEGIKIDFKQ